MFKDIEDLDIYKIIENLCDEIWNEIIKWNYFAQDTIGKQLVRAIDSIGANLVESGGRYHHRDSLNFLYFARASARETRYWLKRAKNRGLINPKKIDIYVAQINTFSKRLNALINSRRKRLEKLIIREYNK
ncbi:MAG: four helix bundle protein [Candidatus Aminicenantia bacterium]